MENCQEMEVYLSLKLDGMLEPEEAKALEEHLAQCPRCRQLERELSVIHTALPELEEYEAPEGFAQGVMERVAALEKKPKVIPFFRRPQVRALMGVAACAVLCIGLYQSGQFNQGVDSIGTVSSQQLDTALYQEQAADGEVSAGARQAGQPDDLGQAVDPAPDETEQEPEVALRGNIGTEDQNSEAEPSAQPSDGVDTPAVQPSQFQTGLQDGTSCTVAGQQVSAVLTVDRLPQGWEDVLGQSPEWLTDEAGRTCCILTADQLQQLQTLAQQEGTVSAALQGRAEEDQPCALVVLETP